MLRSNGVPMFGCGFVHEAMPRLGVGRAPVMIEPSGGDRSSNTDIVSAFGKSTYREYVDGAGPGFNQERVCRTCGETWPRTRSRSWREPSSHPREELECYRDGVWGAHHGHPSKTRIASLTSTGLDLDRGLRLGRRAVTRDHEPVAAQAC
jgi:hypothetical protein